MASIPTHRDDTTLIVKDWIRSQAVWLLASPRDLAFVLVVLLAVVVLATAGAWWLADRSLEAAVTALGGALGFVLGLPKLIAFRRRLLQREAPRPTFAEDPTTNEWMPTNHSDSAIRWRAVSPRPKDGPPVRRLIESVRGRWARATARVWLLEGESSSYNYRVVPLLGRAFLLRVHRAKAQSAVVRRAAAEALIGSAPVFPTEYRRSVIAQLHSGGERWLSSTGGTETEYRLQTFPYAWSVRHFTGSRRALRSTGLHLGRLQGWVSAHCAGALPFQFSPHQALKSAADLRAQWNAAYQAARSRSNEYHDPFLNAIRPELEQLNALVSLAAEHRDAQRASAIPLLHDVHPHNVFIHNDECVLIFDYDWLDSWPHGLVAAFALHRFVREVVVRLVARHEPVTAASVADLAHEFLDAYAAHAPQLPADFECSLGLWIVCANADKLTNVARRELLGEQDPWGRSVERRLGELRKFVRFMKEASKFSGLPSWRDHPASEH